MNFYFLILKFIYFNNTILILFTFDPIYSLFNHKYIIFNNLRGKYNYCINSIKLIIQYLFLIILFE